MDQTLGGNEGKSPLDELRGNAAIVGAGDRGKIVQAVPHHPFVCINNAPGGM